MQRDEQKPTPGFRSMIDAHVHLDMIDEPKADAMYLRLAHVRAAITVSRHLASCKANYARHLAAPDRIFPAYGYHPEQEPLSDADFRTLSAWMEAHRASMIAIGEVGLPYYLGEAKRAKGEAFDQAPYVELLERFVRLAADWRLPIVLHAVYDDAHAAMDLLERHAVTQAHFHWFKGPETAVRRMIERGYYISLTPDIVYEPEIQELAARYPLERIMIETDGPWPFDGPFAGSETHPDMMAHTISRLSEIKGTTPDDTARIVFENTVRFYGLAKKSASFTSIS